MRSVTVNSEVGAQEVLKSRRIAKLQAQHFIIFSMNFIKTCSQRHVKENYRSLRKPRHNDDRRREKFPSTRQKSGSGRLRNVHETKNMPWKYLQRRSDTRQNILLCCLFEKTCIIHDHQGRGSFWGNPNPIPHLKEKNYGHASTIQYGDVSYARIL